MPWWQPSLYYNFNQVAAASPSSLLPHSWYYVAAVKLYEAYNSAADAPVYKNLVRFKGDHNHPRPAFFYSSVCCFFHQQLKLDQVLLGGNPVSHPAALVICSQHPSTPANMCHVSG
jgi:hypothetical protein